MKFSTIAALCALAAVQVTPAFAQEGGGGPTSAHTAKLIEGTELPMELEEVISSKSAQQGDRFTISLTEDVKLSDGTILRAGYKGVGEVLDAEKNGFLGKTGKLAVRLNYLRVGDQRIKIRATRNTQGEHNTAVQVGTLLLLWPALPFISGHSTELKKGTTITGFVDEDVTLPLPLPPPPRED